MIVQLAIDEALINEARALGHFETQEDAVTIALHEFINSRKQREITHLFGTLDPDPDYNYKQGRKA
ncbi:MAG: type II toxin-antitoxin system VapB family antitoxin [Methylococcaceae bacterium]|nr:type II toxin-antitoxin system VapB family antitoxin [Methylococcaceae bacterium]